jgi:hypothetical protein
MLNGSSNMQFQFGLISGCGLPASWPDYLMDYDKIAKAKQDSLLSTLTLKISLSDELPTKKQANGRW